MPSDPRSIYVNDGWNGWSDFLGSKSHPRFTKFIDYISARDFTRSLNLKSQKEWFEFAKSNDKPKNIPANPNEKYSGAGWVSWYDWLGKKPPPIHKKNRLKRTGKKRVELTDFTSARNFVRGLKLKNQASWKKYCKSGKKPDYIPANPYSVYKNDG